jgi:hypothetical protein
MDTREPREQGHVATIPYPSEAQWVVGVDDQEHPPRWIGRLLHRQIGVVAETRFARSRNQVQRTIEIASRIAHSDDCYQRLDEDPCALRFLLSHPNGETLLIGAAQGDVLSRERALHVVKASGRAGLRTLRRDLERDDG